MNFKQFLEAGSLKRDLRQRFRHLPDFTNTQNQGNPPEWMEKPEFAYSSKKQGREDMQRAYNRAQEINRKNAGNTPVFFSLSEPRNFSVEQSLAWLTSGRNQEVSVSVETNVWSTDLVLEGVSRLVMYWDRDVSTNDTPQLRRIPITALNTHKSHYDEAVVNLRYTRWTKLHIDHRNPNIDKYGGDRKSTRLNSSHVSESRMPSSA